MLARRSVSRLLALALAAAMALAATAAGADGLEVEVHDCPSRAWSDGAQALTPDMFDDMMGKVRGIRSVICPESDAEGGR